MQLNKKLLRSYWERWRWELQKRKELLGHDLTRYLDCSKKSLLHIDVDMLTDAHLMFNRTTTYIGRGSFGVVKLKLYQGIYVAVKEFLPCTMLDNVGSEENCFHTFAILIDHIALEFALKRRHILSSHSLRDSYS